MMRPSKSFGSKYSKKARSGLTMKMKKTEKMRPPQSPTTQANNDIDQDDG